MATSDSPLNIKGSIKGLRFYKMEGSDKTYVGEKGGANIELIQKSPKFKKTRLAQNELKGRAMMAKLIRGALGQWAITIVNRHLQLKLSGILQQVQNMDNPILTGKRSLLLSKCKEVLNQVPWHYLRSFGEIVMCPFSVVTSEDKKSVTVSFKGFNPKMHIKPSAGASHFQFCLTIATVSDLQTIKRSKTYSQVTRSNRNTIAWKVSEWIPIDGPLMDELTLTAALNEKYILNEDQTVIRNLVILFGKMTYQMTEIQRDRGSIAFLRDE